MTGELSLGVCGWCLDRHDVLRSIEIAGQDLHLSAVQIGFFTSGAARNADPVRIHAAAAQAGATIVGAFVAFEGEDYSSIERIAATGGFAPDDRYAERMSVTRAVIEIAGALGCLSVALHAGTVPSDPASPRFRTLAARIAEAADACDARNLRLLLETGRESAQTLLTFLSAVDRSNVAVNFDSGNFTVYGTDEPAAAVTQLKGRIELVHLKDAFRSAKPGVEYGRSAPLGQGDVQVARVVSKLRATGYRGPLLIECDTRTTGVDAVRHAAEYLRSLLG